MTDVADLFSAVTSRYAVLQCPSWPDPWPDRAPDDDAYSRVTDPDRYRILFRRVDCWLAELAALLLPDAPRDFGELMRLCQRIAAGDDVSLPQGTRVWASQPWLRGVAPGQG